MGSRGKAAQGHVTDHAGTQLAHGTPPSENWDGGDSRRANATQAERENLLPREAVRCPTYRASGLVQLDMAGTVLYDVADRANAGSPSGSDSRAPVLSACCETLQSRGAVLDSVAAQSNTGIIASTMLGPIAVTRGTSGRRDCGRRRGPG